MIAACQIQDLVCRIAQNHDASAYKELFLVYYERLLNFSLSITRCKETSEEVVSDVFLKIWTARATLPGISNLHLYLYVSVKNHSINALGKQKRHYTFSLDDLTVELKSIYFDPEQLMLTSEMFKRIRAAVQQLPSRCRLVFKLVKEDGLKYREVAELLGLSVKTVETQMSIALRKLGKSIQFDLEGSVPYR
jgi:RNA polymerase sigma-70 factor (ECF subfamily)